jgi:hypothetical protein
VELTGDSVTETPLAVRLLGAPDGTSVGA